MNEGLRAFLALATAVLVTVLVWAFDEPVTGTDLHLGWCVLIGVVVAFVLWYGLWIIIWDD